MAVRMGPLGKAYKKCVTDEKQKNVKKVSGVSEWRGLARSNRVYSEWLVLTTMVNPVCIGFRIQFTSLRMFEHLASYIYWQLKLLRKLQLVARLVSTTRQCLPLGPQTCQRTPLGHTSSTFDMTREYLTVTNNVSRTIYINGIYPTSSTN